MSLDILTERGRIAAADQHRATQIVFSGDTRFTFLHTDDKDKAAVDGFIVRDGVVTGVAEVKSRDTDYDTLLGNFRGEWLLTNQKLLDIQSVARLLCVPGYGIIYLTRSQYVLVLRLVDAGGQIVCKHREEHSETKASCNGGVASRLNSFIDVSGAKLYRGTSI